ncbi:DUF7282 domain-containing protein [Marinobacterium sp. YM272]|uniref:DUF7282 domain-containing protein n=1 Tax=Marinobacterium sp. YM272 TaxID=3421654 RepID=UPI003D7F65D5
MNKQMLNSAVLATTLIAGSAFAHDHMKLGVWAEDQDLSGGTVTAEKLVAESNGWLVVHRTDDSNKPGPVVGHAPLKKGENEQVAAILTEEVQPGEKLMLMLHGEAGGMKTGIFEYTLGAKEDGPVKVDGKLVMDIITAQ